jgi:hypothetical protein
MQESLMLSRVRKGLVWSFAAAASLGAINYMTHETTDKKRMESLQSGDRLDEIVAECTKRVFDQNRDVQTAGKNLWATATKCAQDTQKKEARALRHSGALSKIFRIEPDNLLIAAGLVLGTFLFSRIRGFSATQPGIRAEANDRGL